MPSRALPQRRPTVGTRERVLASFVRLAASAFGREPDATTREWLERVLAEAPVLFDRAFDRRLVLPLLLRLRTARVAEDGDDPEARQRRFEAVLQQTDPASDFERRVLAAIRDAGLPPPDAAQYCPAADLPVQVDFW